MFVTNWISTTKIQKISEITNFFRHYFLSRTEVYICTMKSIIESLAKEEQAILIVALFLLIYVVIMINVMVREYRTYLDDHPMYHFSLGDFIRRGRFYICLILGVVFITFVGLVVSLMAISIQ